MRHLFVCLGLFLLIGCGGTEQPKSLDMGGEDGNKISTLIEDMNDAVGSQKKLANLFASKAPDASKTKGLGFSIVGKPAVNGSTGTAKVRIDKGSEKLTEAEWTFEKVGDKWKIKTAPLQ